MKPGTEAARNNNTKLFFRRGFPLFRYELSVREFFIDLPKVQ